MGLSTKNFIFDEESGILQKIQNSKFEKLFNNDNSVSLKEYSNKIIKYITVIVRNENRQPVEIIDKQYGILRIDNNGRIDPKFKSELDKDAMSIMSSFLPVLNKPENVIDSSSDFAKEKYKNKYTWKPTPELENRIKDLIFTNSQPRKLSEIIIEIAKIGFKKKKYKESELMHLLMFLAHVAWNRDTKQKNYMTGSQLLEKIANFPGSKKQINRELISSDWEEIISEMQKYKRKHFPDDSRKITLIGYTPWETLRVEWEN